MNRIILSGHGILISEIEQGKDEVHVCGIGVARCIIWQLRGETSVASCRLVLELLYGGKFAFVDRKQKMTFTSSAIKDLLYM